MNQINQANAIQVPYNIVLLQPFDVRTNEPGTKVLQRYGGLSGYDIYVLN